MLFFLRRFLSQKINYIARTLLMTILFQVRGHSIHLLSWKVLNRLTIGMGENI